MEYEWVGMNQVPPDASAIPLPRNEYIDDMDLSGDKLSQQVRVDTPRTSVFLQNIRIKSGLVLEEFVRCVLKDQAIANAVLALSTQTVYAAPLRALATCLSPQDLYLAECVVRQPSVIDINIENLWGTVTCTKKLQLMHPVGDKVVPLRDVTVRIEYDSREPYVMVRLQSGPAKKEKR